MNKAEKKFRSYAVWAIFVLLAVLLIVINCVSFTMTSTDADEITQELADLGGTFDLFAGAASGEPSAAPSGEPGPPRPGFWDRFGFNGSEPPSPDTAASVRYFTVTFPKDGEPVLIKREISAVTEEEAIEWAAKLQKESTGWTRGTYRYRVYEFNDQTYVTVIDQSREMLASYRILLISAIGLVLCLIIGYIVLKYVGRQLFAPLEEADRKQKRFIARANRDLRQPLTIISAETELLEKTNGPDDQTRSIHRQVQKMEGLIGRLDSLALFETDHARKMDVQLSDFIRASLDQRAGDFADRDLEFTADIEPNIRIAADPEAVKRVLDELVENSLRYAKKQVFFRLWKESDRVVWETGNDTDLPAGSVDQIFDRFTVLENALEIGGVGLGLASVKEIVKAHDGRVTANVEDGIFTLRITL